MIVYIIVPYNWDVYKRNPLHRFLHENFPLVGSLYLPLI